MKNQIILFLLLFTTYGADYAQIIQTKRIPLLGDAAPSFTARSTEGTIHFPEDYGRRWKLLFSHPADYTSVCSSEIIELAEMQREFEDLGVALAVISTDTLDKHFSWKKSLETVNYHGRNPVKINFPIIEDGNKSIAISYGMLQSETDNTRDVRGVFIINPDNKIAAIFFYPNTVGRNLDEIKRTLEALQVTSGNMVLTPANWKPGDDVMVPYMHGIDEATVQSGDHDPDIYAVTWYMLFRKSRSLNK
jgi:peroxiredoxin (alkyl hydroperoxide reductase subunit C)